MSEAQNDVKEPADDLAALREVFGTHRRASLVRDDPIQKRAALKTLMQNAFAERARGVPPAIEDVVADHCVRAVVWHVAYAVALGIAVQAKLERQAQVASRLISSMVEIRSFPQSPGNVQNHVLGFADPVSEMSVLKPLWVHAAMLPVHEALWAAPHEMHQQLKRHPSYGMACYAAQRRDGCATGDYYERVGDFMAHVVLALLQEREAAGGVLARIRRCWALVRPCPQPLRGSAELRAKIDTALNAFGHFLLRIYDNDTIGNFSDDSSSDEEDNDDDDGGH